MSKHHTHDHVQEEAARLGYVRIRKPPDFRTISWHLKCSKCPNELSANYSSGISPDTLVRHARTRSWDVGVGMRPLCPICSRSKDKAPLAKPEHQNFNRWIPPATLIFDKLLIAAEQRAHEEKLPKLIARRDEIAERLGDLKAKRHLAHVVMDETEKLAGMRSRAAHARAMRLKRIAERKLAQEAGAEALRLEQLKERPRPALQEVAPHRNEPGPQPKQENEPMSNPPRIVAVAPAPKISHAVFQCLDGVFDPAKRLYKSGYTDQRVARECGTSEEVVAYLRTETFGTLAEDPRISNLRDDLELLRMESAETFAKLQKQMGEIASRVEQMAHR